MITLSNGDKWITSDREWEDAGITDEEACKGNIPATTVREFIEKLCEDNRWCDALKLTDRYGGYWDVNFDCLSEVLGDTAVGQLHIDMMDVYEMLWGHIYVVYYRPDSGGYDAERLVKRYDSAYDYKKEVTQWQ